jgi:hypothetical protein
VHHAENSRYDEYCEAKELDTSSRQNAIEILLRPKRWVPRSVFPGLFLSPPIAHILKSRGQLQGIPMDPSLFFFLKYLTGRTMSLWGVS